jgi:hypothetical protein
MEKTTQNRLLYFFVAIFIITNLGFYKTYLIHFPKFEGFPWIYHVHGVLAMAWVLMLIAQSYLIRAKKYDLHRLIGKLSYLIMPLFLLSLFFAAKESYLKNIKTQPQTDALAHLTFGGTIDIFLLGLIYTLAIIYKKNVVYHLRFMASTGLIIMTPSLGRFVVVFLNIPFPFALIPMMFCTLGVGIVWLIMDIKNKKSAFPMGVYVAISLFMGALGDGKAAWWQSFAKWWVETLY